MTDIKFIAWKLAELSLFIFAWPFLFIGCSAFAISELCHDRALDCRSH